MRGIVLSFAALAFMSGCGNTNSSGQNSLKIVGGQEATQSDDIASQTVSLVAKGHAFCSGTLIEEDVVITAAHCTEAAPKDFYVGFGLSSEGENLPASMRRKPSAVIRHEDYLAEIENPTVRDLAMATGTPGNDIALILLESPAPEGHKPAVLMPAEGTVPNFALTVLAGYGLTKMPPVLQFLNEKVAAARAAERLKNNAVPESKTNNDERPAPPALPEEESPNAERSVSASTSTPTKDPEPQSDDDLSPEDRKRLEELFAAFKPDSGALRFTETTFARATPMAEFIVFSSQKKAACSGDSGGPAFLKAESPLLEKPIFVLLGVASRSDCETVGFYTDVRKFESWIKDSVSTLREKAYASKINTDVVKH